MPIVSVIIVTYNSGHVVLECARPLQDCEFAEVFVVDNSSSDNTVEILSQECPRVKILQNDQNVGFSRAVNLGVRSARGRYLLLLNPDATITPTAIESLASYMDRDKSVAIAAPLLEGAREFATINAGFEPSVPRMFFHAAGLARFSHKLHRLSGHYLFRSHLSNEPKEVDWVTGGCMMVRRDVWQKLDGLTERWFMYAEDIEFCLRVKKNGWRVLLLPTIRAEHSIGGSSAGVEGRANTVWITNLFDLYCWKLSKSRAQSEAWRWSVLAGFAARYLYFSVKGMVSPSDWVAGQRRRYGAFAVALLRARSAK